MKILIGIPSCREDKRFWDSMSKFLHEVSKKYDIEVLEVRNKLISDARNIIADYCVDGGFDYLLFLDDDHSGHNLEMLDALIKADAMVCAMKCYARFFPHLCTLMDYSGLSTDKGRYQTKRNEFGYDVCALVGFGMTLIKKELLDKLSKPYFVSTHNQKEDNYFCDSIIKAGYRPMGCFDYVCTHDGIDESNVKQLRDEGLSAVTRDLIPKIPDYNNEKLLVIA